MARFVRLRGSGGRALARPSRAVARAGAGMASGKIIEPLTPGDEGSTTATTDHQDSQFSPVIRRMLPGLARRELASSAGRRGQFPEMA